MSSSWTITDLDSTVELEDGPLAPPISPGQMLRELFMEEMNLSEADVARAMGVDVDRVRDIIASRARISGEDAMRLSHAFRNSDLFWMNLQSRYELELAKRRLDERELANLPVLIAA